MLNSPMYSQDAEVVVVKHRCIICGTPMVSSGRRRIPDYLDLKCFRQWEDYLNAPWMKKLMNMERTRRQKVKRLRDRGIRVEEVSLDALIEAGFSPTRELE